MSTKERMYAVIGGCVGAVLTMFVGAFLPVGAQSESENFGKITCSELRVVNAAGQTRALINYDEYGGDFQVFGKDYARRGSSYVAMGIDPDGRGLFAVSSVEVPVGVTIGVDDNGGRVSVWGDDKSGSATIQVDAYGGRFNAYGKGSNKGQAAIGVNEYGNGAVSTWDKNGYRQ